jgi:hypothetical protein
MIGGEDIIDWLRQGGDCDPPCKSMVAADGCTCALAADALAEVARLRDELAAAHAIIARELPRVINLLEQSR